MRILGIDPGIAQTGWGVVDFEGQRYRPVSFGVIKTSSKDNLEHRIHSIAQQMAIIANEHGIQVVSIEDISLLKMLHRNRGGEGDREHWSTKRTRWHCLCGYSHRYR